MDRFLRTSEGFTLLELVIGLVLGSVILLTASNFLVNFAKYSLDVIKSEAVLTGATLDAFEDIVDKISYANKAVCGVEAPMDSPSTARPGGCSTDGSCIQLRLDTGLPLGCGASPLCTFSPSDYTTDTVYNYWYSSPNLYKSVGAAAGTVIATGITSLWFNRVDKDNNDDGTCLNTVRVRLEAQASSGATGGTLKEYMDTTVVLRGKSAN
jgi:prepilin-type N-terminal cleavage/methylation domain-containing protein